MRLFTLYSSLILLVWAGSLASAPPLLTLPAEVKGQPGDFVQVPAKTDGKQVRWIVLDPGLKLFPVELLKDTRTAVVTASRAGKFRLLAYTAIGDEPSDPAVCVVVIGDPPPDPPGPGPGPVDPFVQALQTAYAAESDSDKAKHKTNLAALYRQAAELARNSQQLNAWGQLYYVIADAAKTLGVSGKLMGVQGEVQKLLKTTLPVESNALLDDSGRDLAAKTFLKIASALEKIQ